MSNFRIYDFYGTMFNMEKEIKDILKKLEYCGFKAYLVGGYVRDYLLNKKSLDVDICTNARPKDLKRIFNLRTNKFGCLSFKENNLNIDITTFRKEENYQKRKPTKIIFIDSLEEDLKRRDFTINTICMDKNNKIYDYYNGLDDLKNKIIKGVGNNSKKLTEDPLRILRAIRIATICEFNIDSELEMGINKYKPLLQDLSGFRIKEELMKILLSDNYERGLNLIKKYDLEKYLGLKINITNYKKDIYYLIAQINFLKEIPFTKEEKKHIVELRKLLNITHNDYIEGSD